MLIILYKIMTFNQLMFRGPGLPFPTTPSPDLCLSPLHLPVCPLQLRSSTGPPSDQLCFHPFQGKDLHEFNINCLQFSENTEKTLTESVYASTPAPAEIPASLRDFLITFILFTCFLLYQFPPVMRDHSR